MASAGTSASKGPEARISYLRIPSSGQFGPILIISQADVFGCATLRSTPSDIYLGATSGKVLRRGLLTPIAGFADLGVRR
jgi:hypothetical protein